MLQQVLEYLHNYFVAKPIQGTWTIADGELTPSLSLNEGQRFWILPYDRKRHSGTTLNEGVYTFHAAGIRNDDDSEAAGLQDETFAGTICALGVPPTVVALSGEINTWVENNSAALSSPLASESFNGYSYTLKSGGSNGGNGPLTWRDVFGKQLERWRKPFI